MGGNKINFKRKTKSQYMCIIRDILYDENPFLLWKQSGRKKWSMVKLLFSHRSGNSSIPLIHHNVNNNIMSNCLSFFDNHKKLYAEITWHMTYCLKDTNRLKKLSCYFYQIYKKILRLSIHKVNTIHHATPPPIVKTIRDRHTMSISCQYAINIMTI